MTKFLKVLILTWTMIFQVTANDRVIETVGTDDITLKTAGSTRVRVDDSGNTGVGGTATGTAIFDVQSTTKGSRACPSMTTTQKNNISTPATGLCVYDTTLNKLNLYNGSAWTNVGGGIDTWAASTAYAVGDYVRKGPFIFRAKAGHTSASSFISDFLTNWDAIAFDKDDSSRIFYPGGESDLAVDSDSTLASGNNATFDGGGTLQGAITRDSTSANLQDANIDSTVFKYSTGTSKTVLNDYWYYSTITIPQGARDNGSGYQDLRLRFWYWYGGSGTADNDIKLMVKCVSGASAGVVSHPFYGTANGLPKTDVDSDNTKDLDEGKWFEAVYPIQKDCATVKVGFQVAVEQGDSIGFYWNHLQAFIWKPGTVDTVSLSAETTVSEAGSALTNGTSEIQYSASATVTNSGSANFTNYMTYDRSADPAKWTALVDGDVQVYFSCQLTSGNKASGVGKNGVPVVVGSIAASASDYRSVSGGFSVVKGDYITVGGANQDATPKTFGDSCRSTTTEVITKIVFTPKSNKKLIVPSVEANRAGLFGSVTWPYTASCSWTSSSTGLNAYSSVAACDDNVRVIKGTYNTTSGAAANSDGQLPQIKFSYMPAGTYRFVATGDFKKSGTGGSQCAWLFSDGTNNTSLSASGDTTSNNVGMGQIEGQFTYTSAQTNVTWQIKVNRNGGTDACNMYLNAFGSNNELDIAVYYFPDYASNLVSVTALPTVDYSWENNFSALVTDGSSTTTVSQENVDFINGNCTNSSAGTYTCTWNSNLFTQPPNVQCQPVNGGYRSCQVDAPTTTSVTYRTRDNTETLNDSNVMLIVSRSGSDYRSVGSTAAVLGQPEVTYSAEYSSGTAGHSLTSGSFTTMPLNTLSSGDAGGVNTVLCTAASTPDSTCTGANQVVVKKVGYYCFDVHMPQYCSTTGNNYTTIKVQNLTTSSALLYGADEGNSPQTSASDDSSMAYLHGCSQITADNTLIDIEYYWAKISGTSTCKDYASAKSISSVNEISNRLTITRKR